MKLNESQINFLQETFFLQPEFPGSREVSLKLLSEGKCIVASEQRLWFGGVGNFIKRTPAEGSVGCSMLTLDISEFLAWAEKTLMRYYAQAESDLRDMAEKTASLRDLIRASNPELIHNQAEAYIPLYLKDAGTLTGPWSPPRSDAPALLPE